ncbi:hypothetical protein FJZ31_16530 [Candidatus Poribacteria bacterium]|nr:hypothetical protein [Candidatus Poribacteria bacterium]
MNLRIIILLGSLGLLGFLFYPRSEKVQIIAEQGWIQNVKKIDHEPLHYPITGKSNPKVSTYDLNFIYKVDKADLTFENPSEQGPRQYDILVSTQLDKQFNRAFSYTANSIEYTYSVQNFPVALEGRWVQVAINDWFSSEPKLVDFKIGAQYKKPGPIVSVTSNCNQVELYKLTDGIISSESKWVGARRSENKSPLTPLLQRVEGGISPLIKGEEVKVTADGLRPNESGNKKKEVKYRTEDTVVVTVDLGTLKKIYGTRLTTDGPANNVKRYSILISDDGQEYNRVYTSDELEDKTISSLYLFDLAGGISPVSARYVRLRIETRYGDYPEMQEFEVFTDEYRLSSEEKDINQYNAIQVYYDNCGEENRSSPNLVQGFPFDRGPKSPPQDRYYLKDNEEVEPGNTPSQKSFAYHYDTIIFAYNALDPQALYWIQVTYLQEKNGKRIQNLLADGFILHGSEYPREARGQEGKVARGQGTNSQPTESAALPEQRLQPFALGKAESFLFSIPSEAYADGRLELHFNRLAGPNAVVSEVALFEAYPRAKTVVVTKEPAKATEVSVPIVIDGKLDEWPKLYPLIPEGYNSEAEAPIRTYLQWDANNLYLGVEVDRIVLARRQEGNSEFRAPDILEVFIDAALNKHPRMYMYSDHHFIFESLGAEKLAQKIKVAQQHHHLDAIPTTIPDRKEINFSYRSENDDKKYVLEARIPKGEVLQNFVPEVGKLIGFNYILKNQFARNRKTKSVARNEAISEANTFWASEDTNATPYEWGEVELVGKVNGEIIVLDETATQTIENFNAGDTITICVIDSDRNTDRHSPQTVNIEVTGDLTQDHRRLTLYETTLEQLSKTTPLPPFGKGEVIPSDIVNLPNGKLFGVRLKTEYGTRNSELQEDDSSPFMSHISRFTDNPFVVQGKEKVKLEYIDPYYVDPRIDASRFTFRVSQVVTVNTGTTGTIAILSETGENITEFSSGDTLVFEVSDKDLTSPPPLPLRGEAVERGGGEVKITVFVSQTAESEKVILTPNFSSKLFFQKEKFEQKKQEEFKRNTEEDQNFLKQNDAESPPDSFAEGDSKKLPLTSDFRLPTSDFLFRGSIKTEYNEATKPQDGVLQIAGAQVVKAQYIDKIQATGRTNAKVTAEVRVKVGQTAKLTLIPSETLRIKNGQEYFNAGDTINIHLVDIDLNQRAGDCRLSSDDCRWSNDLTSQSSITNHKGQVEVTIAGDIFQDRLSVNLEETNSSSGEFIGSFTTQFATIVNTDDAILQVTGKEAVTATYIDALQGSGATNVAVTEVIKVNTGENGVLSIVKSNYITDIKSFNAGDTLYFRLRDADEESPYIQITVTGNKTGDTVKMPLTLSSTTESTFFGELATEYRTTPVLDDDMLQVVGNEKVEFTYLEKLQASGQTNVPVRIYRETRTGYNGRLAIRALSQSERESLEEITTFKAGDSLVVILEDFDLNIDSTTIQALVSEIIASENTTRDTIRISMSEISADAGIFKGEVQTAYGEDAIENDGVLQVQGNAEVTFRYIDALQDTGETQVPIEKTVTVETGVRCNLELYNADASLLLGSFSAGNTILVRLSDNDLNLNKEIIDNAYVTVAGNLLGDEVSVTLKETESNSGIFQALLQTQYSDSADFADNFLQVKDKELVTATYVDRIVGTGEINVPIQFKAFVLSSNPGILLITTGNYNKELGRCEEIGNFNAGETIYFWLEDLFLSTVNTTPLPPFGKGDTVAEVKITVSGNRTNDLAEVILEPFPDKEGAFFGSIPSSYGTTPIYDNTLDVVGDEKVTAVYKPNFPGIYTPPVTDSAYVNKGTRGQILIVRADGAEVDNFNAGATLYFRLEDTDLNLNPYAPDITDIWVHTSAEGIGNIVTLQETAESSNIFSGSLKTEYGRITQTQTSEASKTSEVYTQRLGLLGGEIVTATYTDALIETGETNVEVTDTCRANMVGKATYTTEEVMVDGIPDKWPLENVMRTEQGEALMWAQWDAHKLYLFVQIRDTEVVVPDPTRWYRGADALELHFDLQPSDYTRPSYLSNSQKSPTYIFWLCPKGGNIDGSARYAGQAYPTPIYNYSPPIEMAFRPYADYYTMEIAIPFGVVLGGFDPLKTLRNDIIGFNYIIYRSDAPPVQWAQPAKPGAQIPPSELGILILQRRE